MKIIRTVWGSLEHTIREVSNKFKFENEIIYVWGSDNDNHLKSLGYETFLMSNDSCDPRYSSQLNKYMHKLLAIEHADETYSEYLLIDWDTNLISDLDETFFNLLRSGADVQCPIYALPSNFIDIINRQNISTEMQEYFQIQHEFLKKYSWKFNNLHVIPNFSFFYSNGAKIGKELIKISIEHNLTTNIEEFALYIWANCNLDKWIQKYEPLVTIGQEADTLTEVDLGLNEINSHVNSHINKKIYLSHKNNIKIIRVLWGESEYILNEIPKVPLFDNELVYVWGTKNQRMLDDMGYETFLMAETITDPRYSTHILHFQHKLAALRIAEHNFKEFLFLDWDITLAKEVDSKFYELIRSGNNVQCPLYGYNHDYKEDIKKFLTDNGSYSENTDDFLYHHIVNLYKYHWKYDDVLSLPCFCFFYSNDSNTISNLMEITEEFGLTACIEEFAMQIFVKCTLDEYIDKYEPIVIRGKERDKNLERMSASIKKINKYIDSKINKNIYLLHDIN
jgi:hypothetical protein